MTQHAHGHSELSSTAAHIAGYALPESGEWLREREQNAGSSACPGLGIRPVWCVDMCGSKSLFDPDGGHRLRRVSAVTSIGVTPPDWCAPHTATSSLPASYLSQRLGGWVDQASGVGPGWLRPVGCRWWSRLLAQRELSSWSQYRSNCFSPADQPAVVGAGPVTVAPMPQASPGDDACVLKPRPSPRRP